MHYVNNYYLGKLPILMKFGIVKFYDIRDLGSIFGIYAGQNSTVFQQTVFFLIGKMNIESRLLCKVIENIFLKQALIKNMK